MKTCPECNKEFMPTMASQKYCNHKCTNAVSWRKRKQRLEMGITLIKSENKFVSDKFFDWREFPEGIIV